LLNLQDTTLLLDLLADARIRRWQRSCAAIFSQYAKFMGLTSWTSRVEGISAEGFPQRGHQQSRQNPSPSVLGIMEVSASPCPVPGRETQNPAPNLQLHYTPTYSSWLNQVEIWFSKIQRDLIARGIFESKTDLHRQIMRYIRHYNKTALPFKWT
jgi:hypothetical protein